MGEGLNLRHFPLPQRVNHEVHAVPPLPLKAYLSFSPELLRLTGRGTATLVR